MTRNSAAYMRERRANSPVQRAKDRWWVGTRAAAMEQLAMEYPGRFATILAEIRENTPSPWEPKDA